jgi:quercetin dioxygenase-like cupin family protein
VRRTLSTEIKEIRDEPSGSQIDVPANRNDCRDKIREKRSMSLNIRRVVTGHDSNGKAKVMIDEIGTMRKNPRPGAEYVEIWSTDEGFPISNDTFSDPVGKNIGTSIDKGTVFRVVKFDPGVTPRNHRTDSIDYGVVMSGEIHMELDDGVVVRIKAGDVIVQRGTIHNWINKGKVPCLIAFTLIWATPVTIAGKRFDARG